MRGLKLNKKGLSLIETIFYIAILTIIMVVMVQFSLNMIISEQKNRTIREVKQNLRFAMEKMVSEIRAAKGVNEGSSTFNTHPGVLSLQHQTAGFDPMVFSLSGDRLQVKKGAGSPKFLTNDIVEVTNLIFKNRSIAGRTKNIKISLTIKHQNPDNRNEYEWEDTLTVTVNVRKFP